MVKSGSTSSLASPELLLPRWDPSQPRRAQLEAGLREAIRAGRLRPDSRLPSSRALAGELGVSRRLVVEAYEQLAAEGYLLSRRGSGTRVAPRAQFAADGDGPAAPEPVPAPVEGIDLFPGAPDLSLFPRRAWGRSLRRALAELPDSRLSYGEFAGTTELRIALAEPRPRPCCRRRARPGRRHRRLPAGAAGLLPAGASPRRQPHRRRGPRLPGRRLDDRIRAAGGRAGADR